ncbi:hypothetical protein niasHT_038398 [Heterodera trifolii]|uniref:Uncharacterized protein n=1 Tax=Heterodera trifolii TaxID=157864 RepID=A0ABD2HRG3_9BILA
MEKDTYVDNIVLGIDQGKTIGQTYRLLKTVFQDAGMNVREFVSNDWSEIEKLPEADRGKKEETKLLGVGKYFDATEVHNYELHGFSDASEMGLGCALFTSEPAPMKERKLSSHSPKAWLYQLN